MNYYYGVIVAFIIIVFDNYRYRKFNPSYKMTIEDFLYCVLYTATSWLSIVIYAVMLLERFLTKIKPWWNEFKNKELF